MRALSWRSSAGVFAEGAFVVDLLEDEAGVVFLFFPAVAGGFGLLEENTGEVCGGGIADAEAAGGLVDDGDVVALF